MKVHALLAAFSLPVMIMFFVTGALYTWGVKGDYVTTVHEIRLEQPVKDKLASLVSLASDELTKRNMELPSGQAKVKRAGTSFMLEWTGSETDVVLEPTSQPRIVKLKIKQTGWHRQFVQLHKAKGGVPFKVYATLFAFVLLVLLITGFVMAWQTPKLRRMTLLSSVLGAGVFVVMIAVS